MEGAIRATENVHALDEALISSSFHLPHLRVLTGQGAAIDTTMAGSEIGHTIRHSIYGWQTSMRGRCVTARTAALTATKRCSSCRPALFLRGNRDRNQEL
jgi:hypothetical protein